MDRDRISRAAAFDIIVADNKEVAEPIHILFVIGDMEIGEEFNRRVVGVAATLETVAQEHAPCRALEMLAVELVTMPLKEDVARIAQPVPELFDERLRLGKTGVDEGWAVCLMLLIARQRVVGVHIVLQENAGRDAALVEKSLLEQ